MKKSLSHVLLAFTYKYALLIVGVVMFLCFGTLIYYIWDMVYNYSQTPDGEHNIILVTKATVILYGGRKVTVYVCKKIKRVHNKIAGI